MSIFARTLLSYWVATALTLALAGGLLLSRKQLLTGQINELPMARIEACSQSLVARTEAVSGSGLTGASTADTGCPIQFMVSPTGEQLLGNPIPADISHLIAEQLLRGADPRNHRCREQ